jgi:hypothetical protein
MDTQRLMKALVSIALLFLSACAGTLPPTPYLPPSPIPRPTQAGTATGTPTSPVPAPACSNALTLLEDVTIPDYASIPAGSPIDKQWRVRNSGTCNWDEGYTLRLVGGSALGAGTELALMPLPAGAEVILQVLFTAPDLPGEYISLWQAVDPAGNPFGEIFQMTILVQP